MVSCSVDGCDSRIRNKNDQSLRFFSIPKDPELRRKWILATNRKDSFNPESARICSKHFNDRDYEISFMHSMVGGRGPKLKNGIIPSVKLPNFLESTKASSDTEASQNQRERKELVESLLREYPTVILEKPKSPSPVKKLSLKTIKIQRLKRANYVLEKKLRRAVFQLNNLEKSLNKMFTPGQINKLKTTKKRVNWSPEDIASAISLLAAGSRSYNVLRKRGFPLPGPSTLRFWAKNARNDNENVEPADT